jgi:MFS family permease
VLDGATFLISAFLLRMIRGDYKASDSEKDQHYESPWEQFKGMSRDGAQYLVSSYFGGIVLLKFTISLAYGACDVLNVAFSEMGDHSEDNNKKLGILFALVGIGCLFGPLATEPFTDIERPTTVQLACVMGFFLSAIGYGGWSFEGAPFWSITTFALIRSAGSSIIWINSTLLLQKFSTEQMMGRVLAIDYALALLGEAAAAYLCGVLMDRADLSAYQVSFYLAILSLVLFLTWSWYHISGHGAGKYTPLSSQNGAKTSPDEQSNLLPLEG